MAEDNSWLNMDMPKEVFEHIAQNSNEWLESARRLKISADIIFSKLRQLELSKPSKQAERRKQEAFIESYMMLAGFALENLMKGIYFAENPGKITIEEIILKGWSHSGHGLVDLNIDFPVKFNQHQRELLKRLEQFTIWAGRYPIPKTSSKFVEFGETVFNFDDAEIINDVFKQLENKLLSYLKN